MTSILVTGGAGFIGSALVRRLVGAGKRVITLDKLTYAGSRDRLRECEGQENHRFVHGDIADRPLVAGLLREEAVSAVFHLAAETHVDRSIDDPSAFIDTNIGGTFALLESVRDHWTGLEPERRRAFGFVHVSTDEVFGDLGPDDAPFSEQTPYRPSSPYSASKAGSDHLVRAWGRTYGLPVIVSNCSNNYGPFQYPEKLIPLVILKALRGEPIPVYGDGGQRRDWLHVDDHVEALERLLRDGEPGQDYLIGGSAERTNLSVVETICDLIGERLPERRDCRALIRSVADRPGHDRRYAIDATRMHERFGWRPSRTIEAGLAETIDWYLANRWWWQPLEERGATARRGITE